MITYYTREAGVRDLERKIGAICRKAARADHGRRKRKDRCNRPESVRLSWKRKYTYLMANEKHEVGIVRGLAWTR